MLTLKIATSIAEALALRYEADPTTMVVRDSRSYSALHIPNKINLTVSRYGFKVSVSLYEKNPNYSSTPNPFTAGHFSRRYREEEYNSADFELINWLGPFSKVWKITRSALLKERTRIRDKEMMQLMERINRAVDLSTVQFEKDVLGGKK